MTDLQPPIVLASTSPYRRALLGRLGLAFTAVAPPVDESERPGEAPRQRALRLARAKAASIALQHPDAIVVGSDQVASLELGGATVLHKPGDRTTCRRQLLAMSGRIACFDTAVCVRRGAEESTHVDTTRVHFRELTAADVEHYIDREPAFDCAGGFRCEGLGVTLFRAIETRDPTALVGLPLIWLCEALRRMGVVV
jgi:septum formation protein|nr:MAG: septum formation protein Maf [Pseudomonadota bacterium]